MPASGIGIYFPYWGLSASALPLSVAVLQQVQIAPLAFATATKSPETELH